MRFIDLPHTWWVYIRNWRRFRYSEFHCSRPIIGRMKRLLTPCVWTGDRPGYESQGASCGQTRSRKMGKWLEFGGGSAFARNLGCFPLLLSLEIFTSCSSGLCLSEIVGLSIGSAPEPVDRDRHRVVELLSHSDHSARRWIGRVGKFTFFWKKKKKKDAGAVWYVF